MKNRSSSRARLDRAADSISATNALKRREIRLLLNLPEEATEAEVLQGYLNGIALSVEAYESVHGRIVPQLLESISVESLSSISDADLMAVMKGDLMAHGLCEENATSGTVEAGQGGVP